MLSRFLKSRRKADNKTFSLNVMLTQMHFIKKCLAVAKTVGFQTRKKARNRHAEVKPRKHMQAWTREIAVMHYSAMLCH